MSDGGKGSAPRKQQDQEAYASGWDRIFGKKENGQNTPLQNEMGKSGVVHPSSEVGGEMGDSRN